MVFLLFVYTVKQLKIQRSCDLHSLLTNIIQHQISAVTFFQQIIMRRRQPGNSASHLVFDSASESQNSNQNLDIAMIQYGEDSESYAILESPENSKGSYGKKNTSTHRLDNQRRNPNKYQLNDKGGNIHNQDNISNSMMLSFICPNENANSFSNDLNRGRIQTSDNSICSSNSTPFIKQRSKCLKKLQTQTESSKYLSFHNKKKSTTTVEDFDFQRSLQQVIKQSTEKQHYAQFKTPISNGERLKVGVLDNQTESPFLTYYDKTRTLTVKVKLKNNRKLYEDVCPICLCQFDYPKARLPCKHEFCYACIDEWIKTSTVCPCCRQAFQDVIKIAKKTNQSQSNEQIVKIQVQSKQFVFDPTDYYVCYLCGRGDNQEVLLLCDDCDFHACHIYCDERLENTIPEGDWFCKYCCQRMGTQQLVFQGQEQSGIDHNLQSHHYVGIRNEQTQSLSNKNSSLDQSQQPVAQRTRSRRQMVRGEDINDIFSQHKMNGRGSQSSDSNYITNTPEVSIQRIRRLRRMRRMHHQQLLAARLSSQES